MTIPNRSRSQESMRTSSTSKCFAALARRGLVSAKALRKRAEEALTNYVGDTARLHTSIEMAAHIVEDIEGRRSRR
jgi:hypothetical protein